MDEKYSKEIEIVKHQTCWKLKKSINQVKKTVHGSFSR
jgi:hypothetical protein